LPSMKQTDISTQGVPESTPKHEDPSKVEIRIARTLAEVECLRPAWTSWEGHRDSEIDFVLMIMASCPEVLRPHVIAIYRNGEPDAILIGRLEKKRIPLKIGYTALFGPWARCLTFVYGALRGNASAENSEVVVREVVRCLKNDEADMALLEFIPVDKPLYQKALSVPGVLSRDSHPITQLHDLMEMPDSIDKVYQRMSSERRLELRRKIKKLQAHPEGEMKIVLYREVSELDRLFCDAEQVAKKTYQRGLGAGFSDSPQVRDRLGLAARKGWLRGYLLYIGARPVAFWIGMLCGESFVGEFMGYDPEFRKFAPGMALMMKVLEGFCTGANGDDVKNLDFGIGHAEYKAVLSTQTWTEAAVHIFALTFKGFILKSCQTVTRVVDLSARKILTTTDYFPGLKRWWRDRLAKQKASSSAVKQSVPVEQPRKVNL
jgi:hypothetical protein